MKPAARELDPLLCEKHGGLGDVAALGQPNVRINSRPAIRLGDQANCPFGGADVVGEGAAVVRIGGLPAAAVGHKSMHAAPIGSGSHNVTIGGPTFALPPNLRVGGSAQFRNLVIRDLYLLSTTPTGREILERLERTGSVVTIVPESVKSSETAFEGRDSTIRYNPSDGFVAEDRDGGYITAPPQTGLGHELVHAVHVGEGTDGKREFFAEETRVRGDGMHYEDETINENRLREDLGQPERWGYPIHEREDPGLKGVPVDGDRNLRPGGY